MRLCLSPQGPLEKREEVNKGRNYQLTARPRGSCCISPRLGVYLSSGQSVDRCSSLEDIRQLAETPYASSECATRLPDTCSRSVELSHASVAPRATWLSGKHDASADRLLAQLRSRTGDIHDRNLKDQMGKHLKNSRRFLSLFCFFTPMQLRDFSYSGKSEKFPIFKHIFF